MTENITATKLPAFSEPDAIVPDVQAVITTNCRRQRDMFLQWVDELERVMGITPRTSQIRQFWRDSGKPQLSRGKE